MRGTTERIRVTAQLISSADQTHLWAQSFDREASDALRIQSEVADPTGRSPHFRDRDDGAHHQRVK
jgi:TolB-like protein